MTLPLSPSFFLFIWPVMAIRDGVMVAHSARTWMQCRSFFLDYFQRATTALSLSRKSQEEANDATIQEEGDDVVVDMVVVDVDGSVGGDDEDDDDEQSQYDRDQGSATPFGDLGGTIVFHT